MTPSKSKSRIVRFTKDVLLADGEVDFLILLVVLIDLWWAFALMLNIKILDSSKGYNFMADLFGPWGIVVVCLIFGITFSFGAIFNRYKVVKIVALAQFLFWTLFTYSVLLTSPLSPGIGVYLAVGLKCAVIFFRLSTRRGIDNG